MVTLFQMIGASFVLVQLLMFILWGIYTRQRNTAIVDVGWAVGFILTMVAYFFLGYGSFWKTLLLLLMVVLWASRLAFYLFDRLINNVEDPRYAELRKRWGDSNGDVKVLVLFVFQGVLVTVLTLPFLLVACCPNPIWTGWEIFGALLWAVGLAGETYADENLRQYKAAQTGEVCKKGLWYYSRHPNYFFEWIIWLGFAFYALSSTAGILAFISPALMYYILRYISVPLTEAHLLQSKGENYKQYQETTNEFFPWFPAKKADSP
ncbi:MAG: DUF1295 domain-containing protein [Parachlamydiales bacterium]|jgi:steroid 5-alpha reductase family enzyme